MQRDSAMSDEALFESALDDHPDDHGARLLFAEWLAECGDARAEAYFWMVVSAKRPAVDVVLAYGRNSWDWWSMVDGWKGESGGDNSLPDRVEPAVMLALDNFTHKSDWSNGCAYCEYRSRSEAEEALCRALAATGELPLRSRP
jgi:uncharacterized protein (TIGR02996 family)